MIDLRSDPNHNGSSFDKHLAGRAMKLERLGLAERTAPGCWELAPGLEPALRDLGLRGDIIKTMHRAMTASGGEADPGRFAMHNAPPTDRKSAGEGQKGSGRVDPGGRLIMKKKSNRNCPPTKILHRETDQT